MATRRKTIQRISDMTFDEYSFYLFSKCSFRAFCHTCNNEAVTIVYNGGRVKERYKAMNFVPSGKMLKYAILKDFYFQVINYLARKKQINYQQAKKVGLVSIEKSIAKYKKLSIRFLKQTPDFLKIQNEIYNSLEKHLNLLKEVDFEDSIANSFRERIDIKKYLKMRIRELKPYYAEQLPLIEYGTKPGEIVYDILNVSLNEFKEINVSIVSFYDFQPEQIKKNDFLCILIRWFKKYKTWAHLKNKMDNAGVEHFYFSKLIIYNPLNLTRKEVRYADIDGVFVEKFFLKKLNAINESCILPSLDFEECQYCENARICVEQSRTMKAYCIAVINNFKETLEREEKKFV